MSGRGKGIRRKRTRTTPYDNMSNSGQQWDLDNPSNWTVHKLREELSNRGIRTPNTLPKSVLKQLFMENSANELANSECQLSGQNYSEPQTERVSGQSETETFTPSQENQHVNLVCSGHHADSHNSGQATVDSHSDSSANNMASMFTMLAQCFNGFQQTVNQFNQTMNMMNKGSSTDVNGFNLQQWYKSHDFATNNQNQIQEDSILQPGLQKEFHNSFSVIPRSTTAIQSGTQGIRSDSFSHVDIISPSIQKQIIEGKDVNLASLLIPNYECPQTNTILANGIEFNVSGRPDPRLNRKLSLQEFIKAFGKYKRVMITAFPDRRSELDAYQDDIIDICNFYGDKFYDYHKLFSAKAATLLREKHIKVDWGKRDRDILNLVTAGSSVNICKICNMADHSTAFCPMQPSMINKSHFDQNIRQFETSINSAPLKTDKLGRLRVYSNGEEICNHYNSEKGCSRIRCPFKHVCSQCKSTRHSLTSCSMVSVATQNKTGDQSSFSTPQVPSGSRVNSKSIQK